MQATLPNLNLKNGEAVSIKVLLAPDPDLPRVLKNLKHKSQPWAWHLDELAKGTPMPGLENRFYILETPSGDLVSHIMLLESGDSALLGHVYTPENHRQKGAASLLFSHLMQDLQSRKPAQIITLGTVYDTHPYHLYAKHGFQSVSPGSGLMKYSPAAASESKRYAAGEVITEELGWRHWPQLCLLGTTMQPAENWEAKFLELYKNCLAGRSKCSVTVKRDGGAVLGFWQDQGSISL